MYRTHTCGELTAKHIGNEATLAGWMHRSRDLGGMTFIDLRDRYGKTQLVFNMESDPKLCEQARKLGREDVVQVKGIVAERSNKNTNLSTGDIELIVKELTVLNASKTPPFTIENDTDGGDDLRMKYRFLDLRRAMVQKNLFFRSKIAVETRKYLAEKGFIEVETPYLIKSTPEGARDFVVPSRMNQGCFYALPQSPQTFKQLLMVSGFDKYFQIVKCFRDEDLRADRQPEFTQIDCEMSFVEQEDILQTFESLTKHLFQTVLNVELPDFPRMSYDEAINQYGSDKPDLRFDMQIVDMTKCSQGKGFQVIDSAAFVGAINATGAANYSRKQIDALTNWVKRPQINAKGLIYVKWNEDGTYKSSVDKFYTEDDFKQWFELANARPGDLLLMLVGEKETTLKQLGELRLHMGNQLGLITSNQFKPLWVVDFPLLEWNEDEQRFFAMHHPFTAPKKEDVKHMNSTDRKQLQSLRADAYDLVLNGAEVAGGSIRIYDRALQMKNFQLLGFSPEEAEAQFGFLMQAFEYGAPPHGGIAFGFDRLVAIMAEAHAIRDFIAFPKNNQGKDVMLDAPALIGMEQLEELGLNVISADSATSK